MRRAGWLAAQGGIGQARANTDREPIVPVSRMRGV